MKLPYPDHVRNRGDLILTIDDKEFIEGKDFSILSDIYHFRHYTFNEVWLRTPLILHLKDMYPQIRLSQKGWGVIFDFKTVEAECNYGFQGYMFREAPYEAISYLGKIDRWYGLNNLLERIK